MRSLIKIEFCIIVLLGIKYIYFVFPLHMNINTLWFISAGISIIIVVPLNFVETDNVGSKFLNTTAVIVNAFNCVLFSFALEILYEPQTYFRIIISAISTTAFIILFSKHTLRQKNNNIHETEQSTTLG